MAFIATTLKGIPLDCLLLLMQSAGATVNIIGLLITSSWIMVKTASTWLRSLCLCPSGGFTTHDFVSFHVTLKALLVSKLYLPAVHQQLLLTIPKKEETTKKPKKTKKKKIK